MQARALFAWNLRRLRLAHGLSQEKLAADAGIDRAYISELERKRGNATLDLLDKLVEVLGCRHQEFLKEKTATSQQPAPLKTGRPAKAAAARYK
jgi:transcriptional regulator with XRE-family HTH domain